MKKILIIGLIGMLLLSSFTVNSTLAGETVGILDETVIYVDDDFNETTPGWGIDHFNKTQDAIDIAESGDTIFVYNGTYIENLKIFKPLTLIGESKENTIIISDDKEDVTIAIGHLVDTVIVNISGFSIKNNGNLPALFINHSDNNNVSNNIFEINTSAGLYFLGSDNNIIKDNVFVNGGAYFDISKDNIVENNIVNEKPLVYLENELCQVISNAGQVILINCSGIIVKDQDFTNLYTGVELQKTKYCAIIDNTFSNNKIGIDFYKSDNNTIFNNTIKDNFEMGIKIRDSKNSTIFHNNFIDNNIHAYDEGNNTWDNSYPSGGNYWDTYNGKDSNGDGLGDIPFNISGTLEKNKDYYPLMKPWGVPCFELSIKSGFNLGKVTAAFENTGYNKITDATITLNVTYGLLKKYKNISSTITLDKDESITLQIKNVIGFGLILVEASVNVDGFTKDARKSGFIFGPFILLFLD